MFINLTAFMFTGQVYDYVTMGIKQDIPSLAIKLNPSPMSRTGGGGMEIRYHSMTEERRKAVYVKQSISYLPTSGMGGRNLENAPELFRLLVQALALLHMA